MDDLTSLVAFERQVISTTNAFDALLHEVGSNFWRQDDETDAEFVERIMGLDSELRELRVRFRSRMGDLLLRAVALSQDVRRGK